MTAEAMPWYEVQGIEAIDSPALIIYPERVKHNIALAIATAGSADRLRPHVKTHKSAQIVQLMLQAGITKFKCATIAEAEMLAQCKAPDVLLAYQPVGPKINRFISLIQQFPQTKFSCLIDSIDAAASLVQSIPAGITVTVFLDINIGMNRTGILPQQAAELFIACRDVGLTVKGIHGYDGHIADADEAIRKLRADEAFDSLLHVKKALSAEGFSHPTIIIGGSPAFALHAGRKDVECSPGTFVYWDGSYSQLLPTSGFLPAALVISRVVSVGNQQRLCLDLGHKSIAAESPLLQRIHWMNAPELKPVSHSEEHMVVQAPAGHQYKIGDVLYGLPHHICPTVALYSDAVVVEDHHVKEQWPVTARNRRLSI